MKRFIVILSGLLCVVLIFGYTVLKAGENRSVEFSVN